MKRLVEWPGHAWLALPARLYLGAVFLFACWHKILHPDAFALDVATYQILPLEAVGGLAVTLPWIELFAGLGLVLGLRARASALLVSGMMAMFTVAIVIALSKDLQMGCGCFASEGMAEDPISILTVFRDLGWLGLGLYVLAFDRRPLGLDRLLERRAAPLPH